MSNNIVINSDEIVGPTFYIKDALRANGCRWSKISKTWFITKETNLDEVSKAINEYNAVKETINNKSNKICRHCSKKCKEGYKHCYECHLQFKPTKVQTI